MRNDIALRLARYGVFAAFIFSFGARDACPFGGSRRPPDPPPEPSPSQVEPSQGTFATPPPGKEDPPEEPRPEPVPQPPG